MHRMAHVHVHGSTQRCRKGVCECDIATQCLGLSSSYLREPDWFKLISDLFPALLPHEHLALIFRHATARSAGPRIEPTAEFGNDLGNQLAARAMSFERSVRASCLPPARSTLPRAASRPQATVQAEIAPIGIPIPQPLRAR